MRWLKSALIVLTVLLSSLSGCVSNESTIQQSQDVNQIEKEDLNVAIYIPSNLNDIALEGKDRVPRNYFELTIDALNYWGLNFETVQKLDNVTSNPENYNFLIIIDPRNGIMDDADNWSMSTGKPSLILDTTTLEQSTSQFFNIRDLGAGELEYGWDYSHLRKFFPRNFTISEVNPSKIEIGTSSWEITKMVFTNSSLAMAHFSNDDTEHFLHIAESYKPLSGFYFLLILNYLEYSGFPNNSFENEKCPVIFRLDDLRYRSQIANWKEITDIIPNYSIALIPKNSDLNSTILEENFTGGELLLHGYDHEDWYLLNSSESYHTATKAITEFSEITGLNPTGMVMPYNHLDSYTAAGLSLAGLTWATSSLTQSPFPSSYWFSEEKRLLQFSNYFESMLYLDYVAFLESSCSMLKASMIVIHPEQYNPEADGDEELRKIKEIVDYIESSQKFEIIHLGQYMDSLIDDYQHIGDE